MWGWLMACAVVARVIYVSGFKSDPKGPPGFWATHQRAGTVVRACLRIILLWLGVGLTMFGLLGIVAGQPAGLAFIIGLLFLGAARLLKKR